MNTLQGWLNTSKEKAVVWVKPIDSLLTENIFVNFKSSDERDEMVSVLRAAFAVGASYTIALDMSEIRKSKSGSLSVESTLDKVLNAMVETKKAESQPADTRALAKAKALRESLAKRPPVTSSADKADDDDEFF